jgi:hypothetical protein
MKIHELTTKHEHSRVDHKTWKFTSWPQNMKIHELTTKHEHSRVDNKTWKFTSWPQNMKIHQLTTKHEHLLRVHHKTSRGS